MARETASPIIPPTAAISENPLDVRQVAQILVHLMGQVTQQEVTAATVNAACNCAAQLTGLMRVHLDAERLRLQHAERHQRFLEE